MHVAGVCVLYNPNIELFNNNLRLLLEQVDDVWLIDNSEEEIPDIELIKWNSKHIHYVRLGANMGIAYALNEGCRKAAANGFNWILTLDQDSTLPNNCISEYKKTINIYSNKKIGIITCDIRLGKSDTHIAKESIEEVEFCWTSGSLMNTDAFIKVGGFINELFIDGVDIAYCLSLLDKGYIILKNNNVILKHQLGRTKSYNIFRHHLFYVTHHNRIRRYYITRNYLWIDKKYGREHPNCSFSKLFLFKTILIILLFENDKIGKFKAMLRGFKDFRNNVFGKYYE